MALSYLFKSFRYLICKIYGFPQSSKQIEYKLMGNLM